MKTPTVRSRLVALDWMRGFVMILMAFDHASIFYNGGRVALDTAAVYEPGMALPPAQFFARWITHLCAPTFLFLSGTALALSSARRRAAGQSPGRIDLDLAIRGVLLIALEALIFGSLAPVPIVGVLYGIGMSMLAMVPLRRLPSRVLLGAALAWFLGGEWVTSQFWQGEGDASIGAALVLARHYSDAVRIIYPFAHWLPMMMLGWVFGDHLLARSEAAEAPPITMLLKAGTLSLLVFVAVRAFGGYGNMFLPADQPTLVQWLHVSKYPPSLTFVTLELGVMAFLLAGFLWLEPRVRVRRNGLLLVLGQTALFFYLLHFVSLGISRGALGLERGGIGLAAAAAATVIAALYPLCLWFRRYKQSHPDGLVRFL